MDPVPAANRPGGRRGLRAWALFCGISALAPAAWAAAVLRMGPVDDVGLVVLVGVLLGAIGAGVVASTEWWSSASDPCNRRPAVGPVARGADPGGGGDVGGG
jgi:hypothetical protein